MSIAHAARTHLGLDVSKNTIAVGVLEPDREHAVADVISHDEASVRRLVGRFDDPDRLRVCYEAGPTGFGLFRLLASMQVDCEVVAPSLVPQRPGERVKTDKRDCRRLARLHRAGELTPIRVPSPQQEAVRDLCRARADQVDDLRRARQRLGSFLLRHDRVWRGGSTWTVRHHQWLASLEFGDATLTATFAHYYAIVRARRAALAGIEDDLAGFYHREPFADPVHRLGCYRGITHLGALVLATEIGDWRRFPRAPSFMGFCGLVPSEYSSGESTSRGAITKAGPTQVRSQLVESAWAYQHRPSVGVGIRNRQAGCPPATIARAWKAQQRLCRRFKALAARKNAKKKVVVAVARELAGFVWAEMVAEDTYTPDPDAASTAG